GAALRVTLVDLLARVDAPQPVLLDPAVESLAGEAAPAVLTFLHGGEHAVLELRREAARGIGLGVQCDDLVFALRLRRDQRGALARKQRVIDPALGAFPVADAAPVLELGGDLDRQR